MKIIRQLTLIFVAAFLWSTASFGQNQWTRQSPFPAARNLTGVAWATPTHGFASGESETFIETFDGGATWHNVNLGVSPSDPFYNVYCRDADNCFVIGNSIKTVPTIGARRTAARPGSRSPTFQTADPGDTLISFRRASVLWVQTARRHAQRMAARRGL